MRWIEKRKSQVFDLICKGFTAKEIGIELNLSDRSVETIRNQMLAEYNCKNTPQLVYTILRNRLLELHKHQLA